MSRILAVWEMGANMGHIDRLLLTGRALRQRGHQVRFVLRDLSRAHPRIAAEGFFMGQAPVWLPTLANPPRLGNYSAVLAAAGWLDATGLAGLISGWQAWFDLLQPDALICDHAPTALLAARGQGLNVWTVGSSFEVPPRAPHFPPMAHWDPAEAARCAGYDGLLLPVANQALVLQGRPPLGRLTEVFDDTQRALVTLPELAHYTGYSADTEFSGPAYLGDSGVAPQWPAATGPKVLVYLSPSHPEFRRVLAGLSEAGMVGLVHAKGLSAEAALRLGGPHLRFEAQPVRMDEALAQADLVVAHGGLGTATAALLAGRPQLALVTQMEQHMVGRRIEAAGVGLVVLPGAAAPDWRALLQRLWREPRFAESARRVAARHAGRTALATGERLADLIEASLAPA